MEFIKERFRKNDKTYVLLHRNDKYALFGLEGEYTTNFTSFEVSKIYIQKECISNGIKFKEKELISSNTLFGKDGSMMFSDYNSAMTYFNCFSE